MLIVEENERVACDLGSLVAVERAVSFFWGVILFALEALEFREGEKRVHSMWSESQHASDLLLINLTRGKVNRKRVVPVGVSMRLASLCLGHSLSISRKE